MLGLGAHYIQVDQSLADPVLTAVQRIDVETVRQAREQLAQNKRHLIKRLSSRRDNLGMGV
jgi:hypothetical protein